MLVPPPPAVFSADGAAMKSYPHIAARVFNVPLLLLPSYAEAIADALSDQLGMTAPPENDPASRALGFGGDNGATTDPHLPYEVRGGVAHLPVIGELVNRSSWITTRSGLVSYQDLASALSQAAADPTVTSILVDIDSPGGEASGAMELSTHVRKIDAIKPVTAFVNGLCCSAAYALAAGARRIVVTPSATLGSIGVVLMHIDRSQRMAKDGLKPTLLKAGAFKTDLSPMEPLAEDARARISALLDVAYGLFVSTVAKHRTGLTEAAIRATEAGLFMGADAVAAGFADAVGTIDDARMVQSGDPRRAPAPPSLSARTSADVVADAVHVAEARIAAILDSPEAHGREALARHLALKTSMSVNNAVAAMAASARSVDPASGIRPRGWLEGKVPIPDVAPDGDLGTGSAEMDEYAAGAASAKAALGKI